MVELITPGLGRRYKALPPAPERIPHGGGVDDGALTPAPASDGQRLGKQHHAIQVDPNNLLCQGLQALLRGDIVNHRGNPGVLHSTFQLAEMGDGSLTHCRPPPRSATSTRCGSVPLRRRAVHQQLSLRPSSLRIRPRAISRAPFGAHAFGVARPIPLPAPVDEYTLF